MTTHYILAIIVIRLLTALVLAVGSVYMAINGIEGWIWFIIGAIVLGTITIETTSKDKENDE